MNINNIKNLFRTYFIENWKRDTWYFGVLAVIACLSTYNSLTTTISARLCLTVLALYYAARSFIELKRPSNCIHYLMIPASYQEKVVTKIFLANFYFVGCGILAIITGELVGNSLNRLTHPDCTTFLWSLNDGATSIVYILGTYVLMSIFFFTSVYFKGTNILKTILIGGVTCFLVTILVVSTVALNLYAMSMSNEPNYNYDIISTEIVNLAPHLKTFIFEILPSLVCILFFYTMSFIRLKETEA
ncbi:MAG: hypothetical protein MJZ76_05855 [Bacteroidales bacterium]|nr:hypothetical protein [Bacteroidales bacterium]